MSIYQRINGDSYQNIYVVGDLHGCYDLLMAELEKVEFNKETDLLISVGDLIDRGKQNLECLQLLMSIDGAGTFIFGHTIVERPEIHGNRIYIDTGAFRSGRLTLMKLED